MKYEPVDVQFSRQKLDTGMSGELTVSVNMARRTILMWNIKDSDHPKELHFQPRYGDVIAYKWFGDGYIVVAFSKGFVVVISTHKREMQEEIHSIRVS